MSDRPTDRDGFCNLQPTSAPQGAQAGCLLALGAVLLLLGGGLLAVFFINPEGKGEPLVLPVVAGAFALVGALLLWGAIRGARGLRVPPPELSMNAVGPLTPGTSVTVRLRQPGPVEIQSLVVKANCQRKYQRRVRPGSPSTVEDTDVLWETLLIEVLDEHVPAGAVFEREAKLTLPDDARSTGAGQDGSIRWRLEAWGDAGFMRATYRAFDIRVEGVAAADAGRVPAAADWVERLMPGGPAPDSRAAEGKAEARVERRPPAGGRKSKKPVMKTGAGCLVIGAGFVLCGAFFLWAFFSGVAFEGRGNPYMALVGGALFTGVGLVGLASGILSLLPARSKRRGQ